MIRKVLFIKLGIILMLFVVINPVGAQDKDNVDDKIVFQFETGYLFGGQLYNDNFIYNPGFKAGLGTYRKLDGKTMIGINTGIYSFSENEKFVPIKIEFIGITKKDKSCPYLNFGFGYSFGWDEDLNDLKKYDLKGGFHIGAGLGRKFKFDKLDMLFGLVYEHQFAKLENELDYNTKYTENLNFDWAAFNLKIIF